jgi:hypothetical protein
MLSSHLRLGLPSGEFYQHADKSANISSRHVSQINLLCYVELFSVDEFAIQVRGQ